ncbi:MAG: diguanylate cyclase (GGDEF)-like protein/PAS domain S-box-containing protein [Motiliproteus sp.]|jgi:diguanylate cyclase (GGDEF)-like protein/PAS domain S-box-containing protein
MLKLQRFFSIASFLAIAIAASTLMLILYNLEIKQQRALGVRQNQVFFNSFQEVQQPLYTALLQAAIPVGPGLEAEVLELKQSLALQLRSTLIVKLNIYDTKGNRVFSSPSDEQGKTGSKLDHNAWVSAPGTPVQNVVQSYFPLTEGPYNQIIGAVELYGDVTPEHVALNQQLAILALIVVATMVSLYAALLWIGRRAEAAIRNKHLQITGQFKALNLARERLEQRVDVRSTELSQAQDELQQFVAREQIERAAAAEVRADLDVQQLLSSMLQITMELIPVTSKVERILEMLLRGPVLGRSLSAAVYLTDPSQQNLYLMASSAMDAADYPASLPLADNAVQESLLLSKIFYLDSKQAFEQAAAIAGSHACLGQYWMPILAQEEGNQGVLIIEATQNKDTQWNDEAFLQMVSHTLARLIESDQADAQDRHLSYAMDQSHAAVVIYDKNGNIGYVNQHFTSLTGYSVEEAKELRPALLQSDLNPLLTHQELWKTLLAGQEWRGELLNSKKNGELFWESKNISPINNDQGEITHFIEVKEDITERKHAEQQLQELATRDHLTTLPNRTLLKDRLEQALAHSRRNRKEGALLFIDLDDFKLINDSYGHSVGDALLKEVSLRLLTAVRETDTVGRHGGDEFVIVLNDLSTEAGMLSIVDKIFSAFTQPFLISQRAIEMHCSLGVSRFPRDAADVETLFHQADIAMYQAKELGRNQYCLYTSRLEDVLTEKESLLSDLHSALASQQLVLHFQPKIALASGRVLGSEALIYWQHPVRGLIEPGKLIPLAEESGLIIPIGQWALERTCQQQQRWITTGLSVGPVSVNLSARQLREIDLLGVVQQALEKSGLAADMLELEITESMMMENPETMIKTLARVRALGVQFAIDDFGTGYSSLAYLRQFPIDRINIAPLFIRHLIEEPADVAIVNTIISMAHNLQCKVLAEGVDTREQLLYLQSLGCDEIQGLYFSRPLAPLQFEHLLHDGQAMNMSSGLVEIQAAAPRLCTECLV